MKQPRRFTAALLAALAMTALAGASSASATTLETKGVAENGAATLKTSVAPGTSLLWTDTSGITFNTCTSSSLEGTTSTFTGTAVEGVISAMSWSACSEGNPTIDAKGTFRVTNIAGTTNSTVSLTGTKWTTPSFFGTLTCTTSNTDIGTLKGVKEGTATLTITAVLECTGIGTARWSGTYTVTSPTNLGVGA